MGSFDYVTGARIIKEHDRTNGRMVIGRYDEDDVEEEKNKKII